ncbi:MAG: polymer-forming cytoskeletal protein [Vicinamibacterales bacterium]
MPDVPDAPGSIVIGEGVEAKGTFIVPGRAVLNGTLEGNLVAKDLFVGKTGKGIGKFRAEVADVHGQIHDTLVTTSSLIVRSSGRISGIVYYREVENREVGANRREDGAGRRARIGHRGSSRRSERHGCACEGRGHGFHQG